MDTIISKLKITGILAVFLLAGLACSAGGGGGDIAGTYNLAGTNPDGSTYSGTVEITLVEGATYTVTWNLPTQVFQGTGTLDGNTFTVDDGEFITVYTVQPDGVLNGTWSSAGQEGTGTEVLTPQ